MRSQGYQFSLIALAALSTVLFGVFVWRELFPEYRIYQQTYMALEDLRAEVTGQPAAGFKEEVKQIVMPARDKGLETLDRCISCHVAMKLTHFSPTKIAKDINGHVKVDSHGRPLLVENENYIWKWVDDKIAGLRTSGSTKDLREVERLESLKHAEVGEERYDLKQVLAMHPLLGREQRPFEYHPVEEFGCTSCHSGNGRGLVTDRAHGPVFDHTYEEMPMGPHPEFGEKDPANDPKFAKVFNHKPGHRLLFQTTPIFVGELMQSQCMQCHQSSSSHLDGALASVGTLTKNKEGQLKALQRGVDAEKSALLALVETRQALRQRGIEGTIAQFQGMIDNLSTTEQERETLLVRQEVLKDLARQKRTSSDALDILKNQMVEILGSESLVGLLESNAAVSPDLESFVNQFLEEQRTSGQSGGTLFAKEATIEEIDEAVKRLDSAVAPIAILQEERPIMDLISTETDRLTRGYHRGKELFIASACYGCHRIAGFSRGGVGPELTDAGYTYPWFLKESIVWPQADVRASTMPNFKLDSEEVEDLMAFLLAQKGENKAVAEAARAMQIRGWEAGEKLELEKPVSPNQIKDTRHSQIVFATQGCSSCHKIKGFETDVGFAIDKGEPSFDERQREKKWFQRLFPENQAGSLIVRAIDEHADEIDRRIVDGVRQDSVVAEIERKYPRLVEALYSNFKYAMRAKNSLLDKEGIEGWKARVRRVLHTYIQEYGVGRDIGPRLHWSGIYRDTEWLVGHFRNPSAHTAKSIMPVLPFDDTKFYSLTYMLQEMAQKNRDEVREIWDTEGFSAQEAFHIHCAACHGDFLQGNGVVAEWIYPIPKNLRDPTFLRNLTKQRAEQSIIHGVQGGPMPPWGEAQGLAQPVLTVAEIKQLVDWLFQSLPGGRVIKGEEDVPKWQYTPEDVLKDIQDEQGLKDLQSSNSWLRLELEPFLPRVDGIYASLEPMVYSQTEKFLTEALFDVEANPLLQAAEKELFYIKKKYYTPRNLAEGRRLFIANCSHCHGKEGDGSGDRAAAMEDAKPRMLSNLPWLRTRDDLRLLRSIKYGVPGTSMTPWGDKTNTLQRLQIVMFIRKLSMERKFREDLMSALFQTFERGTMAVDEARASHSVEVGRLEKDYKEAAQKRLAAYDQVQGGDMSPNEAAAVYARELELARKIKGKEALDNTLSRLIEELAQEKSIFDQIGKAFIQREVDAKVMDEYLRLLHLMGSRFQVDNGVLELSLPQKRREQLEEETNSLIKVFDKEIKDLEKKRMVVEGRLPTPQRTEDLGDIDEQIKGIQQMKGLLISGLRQAEKIQQKQRGTFEEYLAQKGK